MIPESFEPFFRGKTVTLLGLGLLGRGVGDAAFLARHCAKVLVTDMKTADELRPSLEALKDFANIAYFLGGHPPEIFGKTDFVIKGAGVRLDNSSIATARAANVPVYMSTALFARLAALPTIGVTGTRGKTTVTCMVAEILKRAGRKVLLGGNIRGVSTLAQLPQAATHDVAVLELDSWQLQGFDDLGISPGIGVFTTFYPDHMNYYDGDERRYLYDKVSIFRHQKPGDTLVTTTEVSARLTEEKAVHRGRWIVAPPLPDTVSLRIPGPHNRLNAALAWAAARAAGVDDGTIAAALEAFSGVEGRLQPLGHWQGRALYNDNNATTQEATVAALESFPEGSVVLIFGGADKGLPIEALLETLKARDVRGVLLKGTGSDRVRAQRPDLPVVDSMAEAVARAATLSRPGDNIVLSPGFASFGIFRNEYDRNDQFLAEIQRRLAPEA